jgi:hypothetical protein
MEKIKCISCGHSFEANKKVEKIKVTLNNPGEVFIEGKVTSCPNCKCQTAEAEDLKKILDDFDVVYEEKHKHFKKILAA